MRHVLQVAIAATALTVVAAWTSLAGADPWGYSYRSHHPGRGPSGCATVYLRPGYPSYGSFVMISVPYPRCTLPGEPVTVRAVRLHDDEPSPSESVTKRNANHSQRSAGRSSTSSRANPERRSAAGSLENASAGFSGPTSPACDDGWRASSARLTSRIDNAEGARESGLDEPLRAILVWLAPPLSLWANR